MVLINDTARVQPSTPRLTGKSLACLAMVALLVLAPLIHSDTFFLHVAILAFINAILVLSLTILSRVGQLSVCPAAFAGIGGYGSALISTIFKAPFFLALGAGLCASAAIAAILGWLILKLRGVYFVLTTFTFGQIVTLVILDLDGITGGAVGVGGIPAPAAFGLMANTKLTFYYVALASLCLVFMIVEWIEQSPLGRVFHAILMNQRLAESCGMATRTAQTLAFVISCSIAGFGGILMAHYFRFIAPQNFDFWLSVTLVVMLVVGGRTSAVGACLGAALMTVLPELLRSAAELDHLLYGVVVLLSLRLMPNGLVSLSSTLLRIRK